MSDRVDAAYVCAGTHARVPRHDGLPAPDGRCYRAAVRYAQTVFAVAGFFNIVVGMVTFLAPVTTADLLGIARPENTLFMEMAGWLIVVLGLGYCLTALNPGRNRDLMLIGGLGKLLVLPLMVFTWRRGDVGLAGVAAGFGDLALALLFFDVMRRMSPPRTSAA